MIEPPQSIAETIINQSAGILTAIVGAYGVYKIAQLKSHVNSRMTEMIDVVKTAAHAVGKLEGKAEQKEESRIDDLTKKADAAVAPVAKT